MLEVTLLLMLNFLTFSPASIISLDDRALVWLVRLV
jgi:hypothetical protein